jgi:hypothetical protein
VIAIAGLDGFGQVPRMVGRQRLTALMTQVNGTNALVTQARDT